MIIKKVGEKTVISSRRFRGRDPEILTVHFIAPQYKRRLLRGEGLMRTKVFVFGLLSLVALTGAAQAGETQIIRAQLGWDVSAGIDVIDQSLGFNDGVPNLGKTEGAVAVKMTSFCYIGRAEEACAQVEKEARKQYRFYREGDHMGLKFGSCAVEKRDAKWVAIAKYDILDDCAGSFSVTRTIAPCGR
jgi:hypothetical protein